MPENTIPQEPGYYWAKWRIASDDTPEADDCTPCDQWEIVQVDANLLGWKLHTDAEEPNRLSVLVCGVTTAQWRDGFVWGSKVADLNAGADIMTRRPDWHSLAESALPFVFYAGAIGFVGVMVLR